MNTKIVIPRITAHKRNSIDSLYNFIDKDTAAKLIEEYIEGLGLDSNNNFKCFSVYQELPNEHKSHIKDINKLIIRNKRNRPSATFYKYGINYNIDEVKYRRAIVDLKLTLGYNKGKLTLGPSYKLFNVLKTNNINNETLFNNLCNFKYFDLIANNFKELIKESANPLSALYCIVFHFKVIDLYYRSMLLYENKCKLYFILTLKTEDIRVGKLDDTIHEFNEMQVTVSS